MNRNQIINYLYNNREINTCLKQNIPRDKFDDFKNELFLLLIDKGEVELQRLWNQGNIVNYVKSIIYIQKNGYKSKYKFNPSFDVFNRNESLPLEESILNKEDNTTNTKLFNLLELIDKWLDTQHWYSSHLFKCNYLTQIDPLNNEVIEPMTLRKLEQYHEYKIHSSTIYQKNKETMLRLLRYLVENNFIEKEEINKKWKKSL